jgi:hypothetical protein
VNDQIDKFHPSLNYNRQYIFSNLRVFDVRLYYLFSHSSNYLIIIQYNSSIFYLGNRQTEGCTKGSKLKFASRNNPLNCFFLILT